MYFEDCGLHQTNQSIEVIDTDQGLVVLVLGILDQSDIGIETLPGMLLEKCLAGDALRTPQKCQGRATTNGAIYGQTSV